LKKKHKRIFTKIFGIKEGDLVRVNGEELFTWEDHPVFVEGVRNELGRVRLILFVNSEPYYIVYLLDRGVEVLVSEQQIELEEEEK